MKYHGAACKTCRRRGRKCSRELPTCRTCADKSIECEGYPLKWAGLASRGFLAGHDGVGEVNFKRSSPSRKADETGATLERNVASSSSSISPQTPINEEYSNQPLAGRPLSQPDLLSHLYTPSEWQGVEPLHGDDLSEQELSENESPTEVVPDAVANAAGLISMLSSSGDSTESCHEKNGLFLPSTVLNPFNIPPELTFVLEYHFYEAASKLCVDNNATQNPYRDYIYPLALQRPALLYACAALSSIHYGTRHQNESFVVGTLRFRGKALSRLQESMWCIDSFMDESNLATLLMLILCDICIGGHSNFATYFTMAKTLISFRGQTRTPGNFVEQYICWMDIMCCASTPRQPAFTLEDVNAAREGQVDWSADVVPCAAGLFQIFLQIVSLYKYSNLDALQVDVQLEALKLRILTSPPRVERGMPWFHLTEAYRFGVLLYTALLFGKDQDEDEINWLVCSIVQHTKSIPSRTGWSDQLLWPLFHAGLRISDPRQQDWLRERFSEMQTSGGFRNVASAQEVLEMCWSGQFSGNYAELLVREGVGELLVI